MWSFRCQYWKYTEAEKLRINLRSRKWWLGYRRKHFREANHRSPPSSSPPQNFSRALEFKAPHKPEGQNYDKVVLVLSLDQRAARSRVSFLHQAARQLCLSKCHRRWKCTLQKTKAERLNLGSPRMVEDGREMLEWKGVEGRYWENRSPGWRLTRTPGKGVARECNWTRSRSYMSKE